MAIVVSHNPRLAPIAKAANVAGQGDYFRWDETRKQQERELDKRLGESKRAQLTGIAADEVMQGQRLLSDKELQDARIAEAQRAQTAQFGENATAFDREFQGKVYLQDDTQTHDALKTQYVTQAEWQQNAANQQAAYQRQLLGEQGANYRQAAGAAFQADRDYRVSALENESYALRTQQQAAFQNYQYNQLEQQKATQLEAKMQAVDADPYLDPYQKAQLKLQLQTQMPTPTAQRQYQSGQEPGQVWQATGSDGQIMTDGNGMPIMLHRKPDGSVVPLWKPAPNQTNPQQMEMERQKQQQDMEFKQQQSQFDLQMKQQEMLMKQRQAYADSFSKYVTSQANPETGAPSKSYDQLQKDFQQIFGPPPSQGVDGMPQQGGIAQPRTPAEAAALPPGTVFIDPNGVRRVR